MVQIFLNVSGYYGFVKISTIAGVVSVSCDADFETFVSQKFARVFTEHEDRFLLRRGRRHFTVNYSIKVFLTTWFNYKFPGNKLTILTRNNNSKFCDLGINNVVRPLLIEDAALIMEQRGYDPDHNQAIVYILNNMYDL